ncbi:MAG: hypothetical protein J5994_10945 [Ruminococcus sp.]|nr:hypothetical protein [Ruminococcus sp.]
MACEDLIGHKFGELEVLEKLSWKSSRGYFCWKCRCNVCGKIVERDTKQLHSKSIRSCGCTVKQKNLKKCVYCGKKFSCSPSSKRVTCSKECSSLWRSNFQKGKKMSSDQKKKISETHKKISAENEEIKLKWQTCAKKASDAAKKSPNSGRFVTHHAAKVWTVIYLPTQEEFTFTNLSLWVRENIERFDCELTDKNVARIVHGFYTIKRNAKQGKNCITYREWQVIAWGDDLRNREKASTEQEEK